MLNIPVEKLKEILVGDEIIAEADFVKIQEEADRLGQDLSELLVSRGVINQDYLDKILVRYFGVGKADLGSQNINVGVLTLLPEDIARRRRAIAFNKQPDGSINVAMEDPNDLGAIEFLERYLKVKINPYLATGNDLNKGFSLYGRRLSEDFKNLIEKNIEASLRSKAKGEEAAVEVPIVAIVDNILSYAVSLRASDIHIEIFEESILIRYRIDGILHEIIRIRKEVHPAIIARLKLLGGMKIDEHSKPQDGRFRHRIGSEEVDVRVSVMPTFYGEKVEMRLLTASDRPLSFQELGMLEDTVKIIEENIKKSFGMILVCGPTGSGKTTTLYSVLSKLNRPQVNIVTIEDPIEYDIPYVNQTQINPLAGITFAHGLRSFLRQDPNIIMVGEIRDNETAEIAVQAALTGHLLLSSLHTNDAPTAIPRFLDMGIPQFLIAAVLNVIAAQRLVRKICTTCIESYPPPPETAEALEKQIKQMGFEGVIEVPKLLYRGKGCDSCGGSGYVGRIGIFEVLHITEEIRKMIVDPNFSLDGIKRVAREQGMKTMFEDGFHKVEKGFTTIEELFRVIKE